jgi:hypothetical protein
MKHSETRIGPGSLVVSSYLIISFYLLRAAITPFAVPELLSISSGTFLKKPSYSTVKRRSGIKV